MKYGIEETAGVTFTNNESGEVSYMETLKTVEFTNPKPPTYYLVTLDEPVSQEIIDYFNTSGVPVVISQIESMPDRMVVISRPPFVRPIILLMHHVEDVQRVELAIS